MTRKTDYLFLRYGSRNWQIKLQYPGGERLAKALGPADGDKHRRCSNRDLFEAPTRDRLFRARSQGRVGALQATNQRQATEGCQPGRWPQARYLLREAEPKERDHPEESRVAECRRQSG